MQNDYIMPPVLKRPPGAKSAVVFGESMMTSTRTKLRTEQNEEVAGWIEDRPSSIVTRCYRLLRP